MESSEYKVGDEVCYFEIISYGEQLNAYKGVITAIMDDAYYIVGISCCDNVKIRCWVKKGRVFSSMKECSDKMQSYLAYSEKAKRDGLALELGRELITLFDIYKKVMM